MSLTNTKKMAWLRDRQNNKVLWKLILTNSLAIGIVIWLAGVSVKDYACLLIEQSTFFHQERSEVFNRVMQSHLVNASILAISIAGAFHFYIVRQMLRPLQQLGAASRKMAQGYYPEPVKVNSRDEIGQLANDFNQMMAQLQKVNEKRNKLMRDISHELRTPLTNINGYLEALSTGVLQGDKALYKSLYEESTRLTRLVEQLHELNVWTSEESLQKRLRVVSVSTLIAASVQSYRLEWEKKRMVCRSHIDEQEVLADPDGIHQVMHHLIKNAIVYDVGGWIEITGKVVGSNYRVTVTNEGRPIPAKEVESIFDRFTRLDSSRSKDTGGAGLGLAIVREIVARHGGKVGLHTSPGHTHSFWFTIPCQNRPPSDNE